MPARHLALLALVALLAIAPASVAAQSATPPAQGSPAEAGPVAVAPIAPAPAAGAFLSSSLPAAALAACPPMAIVLGVVPLLLVLTAFTRIVIVLGFLRQGLGVASVLPGTLMTAFALALTLVTLAPLAQQVAGALPAPLPDGRLDLAKLAPALEGPLRAHLLASSRAEDLALLTGLSGMPRPDRPSDLTLPVLASAYLLGEVRAAFQIGIAVLLPFLLVDLLVAALAGALGLPSFPASSVALVLKLYLFVAVDGWTLVTGSLLRSLH